MQLIAPLLLAASLIPATCNASSNDTQNLISLLKPAASGSLTDEQRSDLINRFASKTLMDKWHNDDDAHILINKLFYFGGPWDRPCECTDCSKTCCVALYRRGCSCINCCTIVGYIASATVFAGTLISTFSFCPPDGHTEGGCEVPQCITATACPFSACGIGSILQCEKKQPSCAESWDRSILANLSNLKTWKNTSKPQPAVMPEDI